MSPSLSQNNHSDQTARNAEFCRKFFLRKESRLLANFQNSMFGQLACHTSASAVSAEFFAHIAHIIFLRSKPKVFHIDASRIVARVKNIDFGADFSFCQKPGYAVRQHQLVSNANQSVSLIVNCAKPDMATVRLFGHSIGFKSTLNINDKIKALKIICAKSAAKVMFKFRALTRAHKAFATPVADSRKGHRWL